MPVYIEYTFKVAVCLAVSFLFYTLLLKRMTHYTWNRYFLLLFCVLSFVVPFINISMFVQPESGGGVAFINELPTIQSYTEAGDATGNPAMFVYWQILVVVFAAVSCVLIVRLIIQFLSIEKIKSKATLLFAGEDLIYQIAEPILPFSFLDNIFINTNSYSHDELQEIISHERVHVQQKHTIDMLLAELVCILNWYNPFAWFIRNAIRENLEFIADDIVIRQGVDRKNYQYLLLKVTGDLPTTIASSFKFSSIKNRIVMINKTKTSQFQLLKFVLLVPVIAVLLLAFRSNREKPGFTSAVTKDAPSEAYKLSTLTYSIPDEKVRSIVIRDKDNSLLKPGELLNLKLIRNEKERLQGLLENNGYNNLKSNAILFMIDTASVDNSFSVEIKIDARQAVTSIGNKLSYPFTTEMLAADCKVSSGNMARWHLSMPQETAKHLL